MITLDGKVLTIDLKIQLSYMIEDIEYIHYKNLTESNEPELFNKIIKVVTDSLNKSLT